MPEMTDNDIIKALECYIKENEFEYFHSNTMNEYPLIRKALDLINRQKAVIKQYEARISNDTEYTERVEVENRKLRAEVTRLHVIERAIKQIQGAIT